MRIIQKHRSMIMVGTLVCLSTGILLLGNACMQRRTERVVQAETSGAEQFEELSPEDVSKSFAQELLETMPDAPLLQENAKDNWGDSSLENCLNDVNAGDGAKEAIIRMCQQVGIDAAAAKVRDLTWEQIVLLDQEVYRNSTHSKN